MVRFVESEIVVYGLFDKFLNSRTQFWQKKHPSWTTPDNNLSVITGQSTFVFIELEHLGDFNFVQCEGVGTVLYRTWFEMHSLQVTVQYPRLKSTTNSVHITIRMFWPLPTAADLWKLFMSPILQNHLPPLLNPRRMHTTPFMALLFISKVGGGSESPPPPALPLMVFVDESALPPPEPTACSSLSKSSGGSQSPLLYVEHVIYDTHT